MTHQRINTVLAALVVLAGFSFGLNFLLDGPGAAAGFGIDPWPEGNGYFVVKGVRDLAYGLTALILLLLRHRRALGWVVLADAIIPIGDCVAVMTDGGTVGYALAVHGSAAVLVLVTAASLLWETRKTSGSATLKPRTPATLTR
ncbi:DUF4267 domain-containing protein [Saccharothrix texasensis]|uniref:Uncharacterized protein DUF4267 n=1 Tax=Saccharothrix texasensis TaxID=103734 RepID=A0A3N1H1I6_9PSEU|nr:DUF4267 domain-containing protein [Saccharothrix texasensis]ROP36377.1 uncharacterized protein DUF4267 [Saccharothrix texasensis]